MDAEDLNKAGYAVDMLTNIELRGFKSIRDLGSLELRKLNVLIGANGSGKSNLIAFFRMLSRLAASPGRLQEFIGMNGGGNALLFDGASVTPQIEANLVFQTARETKREYYIRLGHAAEDTLIFNEERYRHIPRTGAGPTFYISSGHREASILKATTNPNRSPRVILDFIKQCRTYQFHNTSDTARIRQKWNVEDDHLLREDGANLASFLRRMRESAPEYYLRIVEIIRDIAPFFADFELDPVYGTVSLRWRERGSDVVFGPHQASDGTLRMMALVALLMQPPDMLPKIIILDEPELGLHPYAIAVIAGLLKSASTRTQVILATQSTTLVDQFDPEDIIVVDRRDRESEFRRLDTERLKEWLDEYSLGELWEKNVLGGRPS